MKKKSGFIVTLFGFLLLAVGAYVVLEGNPPTKDIAETAADTAREIGQDTVKEAKSGIRKVQDETCEMFDSKIECAAQKAKHKAQDAADEVEDKMN